MPDTQNTYKDSRSLTLWVRYFLYAQVVIAVVSLFSNFLEYQLLSDFESGVYTSQDEAIADGELNDQRQQFLGVAYTLVFLASGFLILRWIHRANYNARQLGAQNMTFTPGWSIGYYFIPILALWKPYQAMKEIWQASYNPGNWTAQKAGNILSLWWFLWIVSSMLGQAVFRMAASAEGLQELMRLNIVTQISDALDIPLALVTLAIVNAISNAQTAAHSSAAKHQELPSGEERATNAAA